MSHILSAFMYQLLYFWIFLRTLFFMGDITCSFHLDQAPYISPLIIDDLCSQGDDTGDQVVAIDVLDSIKTNRYFGDIQLLGSSVCMGSTDRIWYECVGKTVDGIYALKRGHDQKRSVLLVAFQKVKRGQFKLISECEDQSYCIQAEEKETLILKKLCEIALDESWDGNAQLKGNELFLGNHGQLRLENRYIRWCRTHLFNPSISYPSLPYFLDRDPYIKPKIIADLLSWLSDFGNQVVLINLNDSQEAARYQGKNVYKSSSTSIFEQQGDTGSSFQYWYIGRTNRHQHVLKTIEWGGGSGEFVKLLIVGFERDYGMTVDWNRRLITQNQERILIKKWGEWSLGDRWDGTLRVEADQLHIGADCGWFSPLSCN